MRFLLNTHVSTCVHHNTISRAVPQQLVCVFSSEKRGRADYFNIQHHLFDLPLVGALDPREAALLIGKF